MSDTEVEGADEPVAGRGEIWIEKYRPDTLEEVVGHEAITGRLKRYVAREDLSHLLFAGPAGTGKCVTGKTPVLTNRGVQRIETVVGDCDGFGKPDEGLEVVTFDGSGAFEFVAPTETFSKRTDGVVTIETRDGGELTATEEHPLLVAREDGFEWTEAGDLEPGDRIARPLRTPLPDDDAELDWPTKLEGERTLVHVREAFARKHDIPVEENYVGKKKQVIERLRLGDETETIADEVGVPKKTVQAYQRDIEHLDLYATGTTCSLEFLRELDSTVEELREHVIAIQYVTRYNNRSRPISPPDEVTPGLAEFIGLAVSEARIDGGRIQFYNTDESLLNRFERLAESLFGAEPSRGENQGVPFIEIGNRTLTHFLESCFDVFDGATGGDGIGSKCITANQESHAAFLRAVFDSEAYVDERGTIELTQKNEQLITLLSYLLAGFGIPSRRTREQKSPTNGSGVEREYHTLYISGARPLARFQEEIGFTLDSKAGRLAESVSRESNPNHDTVPVQRAVDELCDSLYLCKGELLTDSLNPETPGRENYLEDVDRVLDAAVAKVETAQEVLERVDQLTEHIDEIMTVPARWAAGRAQLQPLATRKTVEETTGVSTARLIEYADGRRTPRSRRVEELLVELEAIDRHPSVEELQSELKTAIERLSVPYNHIAERTELRGTEVINLLENDDHQLSSLSRFGTVAERVREVTSEMLTTEVLEALRTLDILASGKLYFDEVEHLERAESNERVYDLTVPETHNYVAGNVPTVMHNTASAVAIAKELYGDDWNEHFLELNASDQRGIDVVRNRIKDFARSSFDPDLSFQIIFLDEADALTSDAQSALRRTMEQFSSNTRFVLSCNYSSQIIDPIQSRCAVFRFSPLADEAVEDRIREIAEIEGVEITDDGVEAIVYAADGDMRKAINALQAAAVMGETVDEETVYAITSTARPEEIQEMVQRALDGDFTAARARLDELLTEKGIAGGDVIDQLHRAVWEFEIEEKRAVRLLDRVGEADYRITEGANERIQLEALLASLALDAEDE